MYARGFEALPQAWRSFTRTVYDGYTIEDIYEAIQSLLVTSRTYFTNRRQRIAEMNEALIRDRSQTSSSFWHQLDRTLNSKLHDFIDRYRTRLDPEYLRKLVRLKRGYYAFLKTTLTAHAAVDLESLSLQEENQPLCLNALLDEPSRWPVFYRACFYGTRSQSQDYPTIFFNHLTELL